MTLHARFCTWLLLLLPCVAMADSPVTITPAACFEDMAPRGGVYPLAVSLHNSGASADGALIVRSESYSSMLRTYAYPVSLPTGTDKEIIVYPSIGPDAFQIDFSFEGNSHADKEQFRVESSREGMQIGMIGDEPGALSSLRLAPSSQNPPASNSERNRFSDCYARPEDAPDRAAGYQSLSVLVLGAGAERMRPEQWDAIRRWVLDGGSLILTGGAGASYLRVPQAADLLPVTSLHDETISTLTLPQPILDRPLPGGPIALVSGKLQPGATAPALQGADEVLARQTLGTGTVLLVGFNPLDEPFKDWAGQHDLWLSLVRLATPTIAAWELRQWTEQQTSFNTVEPGAGMSFVGVTHTQIDPFRIKLPPLATIAWLFLAYFILVIPVTYGVLRRLNRLEWAWLTSPLLSIAFAYAFYLFTAQLYQAGMSRRSAGVLVAESGSPDAQFDGFSELFIPHGGSYSVKIPGAEALELSPFSDGYRTSKIQALDTVDLGDVTAPQFSVGNLAFTRVYHTEPISLGGPIIAKLSHNPQGGFTGTVRNGTTQSLLGCGVYEVTTKRYMPIGDLQPGESRHLSHPLRAGSMAGNVLDSPFDELANHIPKTIQPGAFLIARTNGAEFGPQSIGKDVGGTQSIIVLVSIPVMESGQL